MTETGQTARRSVWHKARAWFVGLILLSGLILIVTHYGELAHFVRLVRQAEPLWLIMALLLQSATYVSVASVWYLALRKAGLHHSFISLIPIGVAKLFSDQAMPSAGMSGTAFFITALNRRGVPTPLCMASLLLSLVAFTAPACSQRPCVSCCCGFIKPSTSG